MQHSGAKDNPVSSVDEQPGTALAVIAELLNLLNLTFLPVIGFIILTVLYLHFRNIASPLARCHLAQTFVASLWAGFMLVIVNGLIIFFGGYTSPSVWIIVILYLTSIHSVFIIMGTFGLTRAMNGKYYYYPLIGVSCLEKVK